MCGLTGLLAKNSSLSVREFHKTASLMLETLTHRGPDAGSLWQDPDSACVLGHRRLAIIDLSESGAQPMESASGRYMIVFNGEIYNFLELRRDLEAKGAVFKGRSDTEVMLAAIEIWGLNLALQKFGGMFAFALWDRKERELHLVRDRLGKKPLYVGWAGGTLVFGSELKALCAHPQFSRALDQDALALYMRYSCVPAPRSIYKNCWSVPAGNRLKIALADFNPGSDLSAQMESYWSHLDVMQQAHGRQTQKTDIEMIGEFEALLEACVEERMISDVPLGAFLSGGIDSSTIVALMQKKSRMPVKTYSIGFKEAGFDEAQYARKIAAHLGTDHHELYVDGGDALAVIPHLSSMYDEPFADISAIPTYLVCKFARQDVTVALSGDGGDEMLGGYNRHVLGPKIWNKMNKTPAFARGALAGLIRKVPTGSWDKIIKNQPQAGTRMHKIADILGQSSERDVYMALLSNWSHPEALVKGAREPKIPLSDPALQPDAHLSFSEKMMYWDALSYLPDDILVKVDRASMAVSLEARAPLLDRKIYEHVWRLPERAKIRDGKGKWLLREVLARHVPREYFERPKQGFAMPVGTWLRGELKDWAEVLLDEKALAADDILDAALVRKIWNEHKSGSGNHAERLWSVLMFQSWKQKWLG